ncbi:copper amine oxidase N-terminal domain-containing protein [Paenibacillus pasadenensis]|nr:copper amine oxidase N-terminal domain-containing protein [Paenibacillus pasadenensis]
MNWKNVTRKAVLKAVSGVTALAVVVGGSFVSADSAHASSSPGVNKAKLQVEVLFNARKVKTPGGKAQLKDGSVFVPIRAVSETLGAKVAYSGKEVTITKESKKIQLTIGTKRVVVNGKALTGIGASFISAGSTMVPIRVISESFGEAVEWDSINQFVWIGSKDVPKAEDVLKPVPIKNRFDSYYKGREHLLVSFDNYEKVTLTEALVIKNENLPLQIGNITMYRINNTTNSKGEEYIQTISNDRSSLGLTLMLLSSDYKARLRGSVDPFSRLVGQYKMQYYQISVRTDSITLNDKTWDKLKLEDINFLELRIDFKYMIIYDKK